MNVCALITLIAFAIADSNGNILAKTVGYHPVKTSTTKRDSIRAQEITRLEVNGVTSTHLLVRN
jgi:hypothetical protein